MLINICSWVVCCGALVCAGPQVFYFSIHIYTFFRNHTGRAAGLLHTLLNFLLIKAWPNSGVVKLLHIAQDVYKRL